MGTTKHDDSTLAGRLKHAMALAGLTQEPLALRAGISQTTVTDIARGRNATSKKLPLIAKALGVRLDWLTTGQPPMRLDATSTGGVPLDEEDRAAMLDLAERVVILRDKLGFSVAQLCRGTTLTPAEIEAVEDGRLWLGPAKLDALATKLGTSADWLVRGLAFDSYEMRDGDHHLIRTIHDVAKGPLRREV
ncbi:MAG: helix-turn-helix domain-containing protein [Pikeienuella sp.]|uniref:helix-turn-helix domain-containing protein n=1 Tax=Pikeienuella sp. TaxID=2831957 RepID=UPI003918A89B